MSGRRRMRTAPRRWRIVLGYDGRGRTRCDATFGAAALDCAWGRRVDRMHVCSRCVVSTLSRRTSP